MRLVHDDCERFEIIERARAACAQTLLAYCLMDNHAHFVVEGEEKACRDQLHGALRDYTRAFNKRHGVPLLRDPITTIAAPSREAVAKMIQYAHRNPLKTTPKIVIRSAHYEWSSARAFAGLSRAPFPNVERACRLAGEHAAPLQFGRPTLAHLEPLTTPIVPIAMVRAVAAQTFGVLPEHLATSARGDTLRGARAVFVALGRLEGYGIRQLAVVLERTVQRAHQLADEATDLDAIRIARTLLREPNFAVRLVPPATVHRELEPVEREGIRRVE